MNIETERLLLREYTPDDFDALYEIVSDPETMAHYPAPFDKARTRHWIDWNLENYARYGFGLWAVILKETGEFIGDCGITIQNIDGEMLPEIGYHIHKKYWRRGFAKEAARAVRDWAFLNTKYNVLYSYMKYTNEGSWRTAMANGMKKVKEYPDPKNTVSYAFSITREEWIRAVLSFRKFTDFDRGIMYSILKDAYSFDKRCAQCWDENWRETDDFFFDHPEIADKYGFVTCFHGEPIGFISWDPRNRPEYMEIGHNAIRTAFKGNGFGKAQLTEALRRIREYDGLEEIRVRTNSNLIAPKNYESVGFVLYDRKENQGETAFSGDDLYYRIQLRGTMDLRNVRETFPGIGCARTDAAGKTTAEYYGVADRESNAPVNRETIFPACSVSKFITAVCVMKLQEQGVIDIDRPVNHYLQQWKLRTPDGSESSASIRSVLCHTAGILDGEDAFYGLRRNDPEISLVDILEGKTAYNNRPVRAEKPQGEAFEYSDAGYCVLQQMLQETMRQSFDGIVRDTLFDPLGLRSTFFATPGSIARFESRMATGYDEAGLPIPGRFPSVPDLAASGLWSTPEELLVIAKEFLDAYDGRSSFLQKKTVQEMVKPVDKFPWACIGLFIGENDTLISRGWGENGQCILKMRCRTGEIAAVMTNRNPGVDQQASGVEWLADRKPSEENQVSFGTPDDIESWMDLVRQVSWNFPGLEKDEDLDEHRQTVLKFMGKKQALCTKNDKEVTGVLLFSRNRNMICCLAVSPEQRRKGIASKLLEKALDELDRNRDITVSTFREEDEKGVAPRSLYRKYGFHEAELTEEFGYPNQVFVLKGNERNRL